MMEAAGAPEH